MPATLSLPQCIKFRPFGDAVVRIMHFNSWTVLRIKLNLSTCCNMLSPLVWGMDVYTGARYVNWCHKMTVWYWCVHFPGLPNPFHAVYIVGNIKYVCIFLLCFSTEMTQFKFLCMEDKNLYIAQSQCHSCWWPGNVRSQVISSYGIGLVCLEYFGFSTSWVNITSAEIWEWISNFIPYFIMDVITYPCWD